VKKPTYEELDDLYSSPDIIRVMKSRRMRRATHLARMGDWRHAYQVFVGGELRDRTHLKDLGVDGKITLKWIFKKWEEGMDWIYLAQDRDRWRAVVNEVMNLRVS
jgi:hypothetical protein